jgi:hypothetical protein
VGDGLGLLGDALVLADVAREVGVRERLWADADAVL